VVTRAGAAAVRCRLCCHGCCRERWDGCCSCCCWRGGCPTRSCSHRCGSTGNYRLTHMLPQTEARQHPLLTAAVRGLPAALDPPFVVATRGVPPLPPPLHYTHPPIHPPRLARNRLCFCHVVLAHCVLLRCCVGQQTPAFPPLHRASPWLMEEWSVFDSRPDSAAFPCLKVVSALDLRSQATEPPRMTTGSDRNITVGTLLCTPALLQLLLPSRTPSSCSPFPSAP
jgi:hypothetical protein